MNNQEDFLVPELTFSQDQGQLIMDTYRKINDMITTLNAKTTGIYNNEEQFTCGQWLIGQQLNQPRPIFRIVIDTGVLPNAGTKNVAHNLAITSDWDIIDFFGVAKNPTILVFSQMGEQTLLLDITATNIKIVTSTDWSAYTTSYVTILYMKP